MKKTLILFFALNVTVFAELPDSVLAPQVQVHATRLTGQITLDGKLNESIWQNDYGVTKFTQREPVSRVAWTCT